MSKIKCVVTHPNLHLAVGGKLQRLEKGANIEIDEKLVARHLANGNLQPLDGKVLAVGGEDEGEALKARAKELNITNYSKMKPETLKSKIAEAEEAIASANEAAGQ